MPHLSGNYKVSSYLKIMLLIIIPLLFLTTVKARAEAIEDIFNNDRNLLAISRYNNLAAADTETQKILASINPQTPTTNPILALLASQILVANIGDIDAQSWSEALYFSQPTEKSNDWVYIFHVKSPEKYVGSLLGTGNIRQELSEDNITRYRRTDGLDSEVYYLAYGTNNLAIISKNFDAVSKALDLYNDEKIGESGIIPDSDADYTMTIHLNRYFQANSRVLSNFLNMVHYDLLRDLAGTTAKEDNILNLILNYLEDTIKSLINEIAVIDIKAYLTGENVRFNTKFLIQYGGSLHYALSAYESRDNPIKSLLPPDSIILSNTNIWPEEYIQLIEGLGNLSKSLDKKNTNKNAAKKAENILTLFQKANPRVVQQGIIPPTSNTTRFGPTAVSVITLDNPDSIKEFFKECAAIFTTGDYSEFLAEKGLKLEIQQKPAGMTATGDEITESIFLMRSNYFTLPDAFLSKQYILSTFNGNKLITVSPLATINDTQYEETRDFCLQTLNNCVKSSNANAPDSNKSPLITAATANNQPNTILNISLNPLRYIQVAMQAESLWPTPSPPNRLPIAWHDFSRFFNAKPAVAPPLNFTVNSDRTSINSQLIVPKTTLIELLQALLNLTPGGGF